MLALLKETFRLLGGHLDLFTLIALSVWLPGAVFANYLEFFEPDAEHPGQPLAVRLAMELAFSPLVAAATVAALSRLKRGLPAGYAVAMTEGIAAWGRLFVVRLVTGLTVAVALLALVVPGILLLLRWALVDSVVVLEKVGLAEAWRRSAELTLGQRRDILLVGGLFFIGVLGASFGLGALVRTVPLLNHFVVRVLMDCVLVVLQTVFTVALFLFYWRRLSEAASATPS